jgi:hypothetical protein
MNKQQQKIRDEKRIALYKKHCNTIGEQILRVTLKSLASVEAGDIVNIILEEKLKLTDVSLDKKELDNRILQTLRVEIAEIIINNSSLSTINKNRLMRRVMAQISPTKDNVVPPVNTREYIRPRVEDLENIIRREAEKLEK